MGRVLSLQDLTSCHTATADRRLAYLQHTFALSDEALIWSCVAVSYTHLDVYKRQNRP